MSVNVLVHDEVVEVEITGFWDRTICFSRGFTIPIADIVAARLATWDEVAADLGARVGGGYWPGRFATGWFTFRGRRGGRQWFAVFRDRDRLLVIDTKVDRPCRVVIGTNDGERLAWWINERL